MSRFFVLIAVCFGFLLLPAATQNADHNGDGDDQNDSNADADLRQNSLAFEPSAHLHRVRPDFLANLLVVVLLEFVPCPVFLRSQLGFVGVVAQSSGNVKLQGLVLIVGLGVVVSRHQAATHASCLLEKQRSRGIRTELALQRGWVVHAVNWTQAR